MNYILIDNFNDTINIVCKDDGSGEPLIFNSLKEAEDQLNEVCQNGFIVPLADTIFVLKQCFELIHSVDETTPDIYLKNLEKLIQEILI